MATLLSGISAGAHQGLASLVTSKRANRQMAREQRRYEDNMMLQLGSIKAERDYRNKMLAYRKTRDEIGDQQWAQSHGLDVKRTEADIAYKEDSLAATIANNAALNEDRDLAREQAQNQFDATLAENRRQFGEAQEQRRTEFLQDVRDKNAALAFEKEKHLDAVKDQGLARKLQAERDETQADYYDRLLDLREQALDTTLSPEERAKIEAEIERIEAQTELYKAQTGALGSGSTGGLTFPQSRTVTKDYSASVGDIIFNQFTAQGKKWTVPFAERQVNEGSLAGRLNWDFPGRMDNVYPWDSPKTYDPNNPSGAATPDGQHTPTQRGVLQDIGGQLMPGLLKELNYDVNAAMLRLPTILTELLSDTDNPERKRFMSYLMHNQERNPQTGRLYTELEMIEKAKAEIVAGAQRYLNAELEKARNPGPAPGGQNDPMLDYENVPAIR